jgi:phosphohistidine phosphatase
MKTILLFRHAKSDWTAEIPDHERPLADRGRKAAVKMGRIVTASGAVPERTLVSSARRTRETVELAAEAGKWEGPVRTTDALYEASPEGVLAELQAEPDDVACVAVVGHEPTTSRLAALLVGGGTFEVKTAAVLRIDVPVVRWADVVPGRGALVWMLAPESIDIAKYRQIKKKAERAQEKAAKAAAPAAPGLAAPGHLSIVPGAAEAAAPEQ